MEKEIIITLEDWDYECGDGCCHMYGTEISVNGEKCENQYVLCNPYIKHMFMQEDVLNQYYCIRKSGEHSIIGSKL